MLMCDVNATVTALEPCLQFGFQELIIIERLCICQQVEILL